MITILTVNDNNIILTALGQVTFNLINMFNMKIKEVRLLQLTKLKLHLQRLMKVTRLSWMY